MSNFLLEVPGIPRPKGSLRHVGKGRLVEQTKVKDWMGDIRKHTAAYAPWGPLFDVPVKAELVFRFPRPAAAKNRLYPHMRSVGDLDKLVRAVLDALQPEILADDSLVVELQASKLYEELLYPAGVTVHIEELT